MQFFTRSDLAGSKSYVYAIIPIYRNDGHILYVPPANFYDNLKEKFNQCIRYRSRF